MYIPRESEKINKCANGSYDKTSLYQISRLKRKWAETIFDKTGIGALNVTELSIKA